MSPSTIDTLNQHLHRGEHIDGPSQYKTWQSRTRTFLGAAMGPGAESAFITLGGDENDYHERLAMQLGYLEGQVARLNTEPPADPPSQFNMMGQVPALSALEDSKKVFIVHGHDNEAKETVARFLTKLGVLPIILHEQASSGRTIIEKFEAYSGDVGFAVVLLTPDDVGSSAATAPASLRGRARQNVIMELGYFIGKLGRTRVCALHKGDIELPSDYQGVLYVDMDSKGAWKTKLAQEMVQSKVQIELTGLLSG